MSDFSAPSIVPTTVLIVSFTSGGRTLTAGAVTGGVGAGVSVVGAAAGAAGSTGAVSTGAGAAGCCACAAKLDMQAMRARLATADLSLSKGLQPGFGIRRAD
ncbi:MAG: hypothetical protein CTY39_09270 [Hyphomicrobium sp.]|nr:MAG: hypothetical protein CTY39_09270 [Hyphomicrobium sp.]